MIGKLTITVTKTADGLYEYIQIASPAAMPINIVLIADVVEIQDRRLIKPPKVRRYGASSEGPTP
jgi:hypothetical protein